MKTIRADEVKPGDYLHNSRADHPAFAWVRVRAVEPTEVPVNLEHGGTARVPGVRIETVSWTTYKPAAEAVAVRD